jgi:hypothetical protein
MSNQIVCEQCKHNIECALKNIPPRFEDIIKSPFPRSKLQLNRWQWDVFNECLIMQELYKIGGRWDY